ncbi:PfkB family carbohydrate kinase [Pantoea sp. PNT03]|jgi:sugar/nucleoside kinase (ribokinase family)|uniref:PfkB family carbohydrate kinase n=1 Tax=Pantoea sp. PNT03 TaxID=2769258 RepID=UPI00177C73DE|nr:PfkB family carbohydrate kinase [Pantoea sp. PNT03]MBD9660030.1 carbohydrate kinase [Pantoea sp. PNT03]
MLTPDDLQSLESRLPVLVIGAAVVDVIADAYSLPHRGSDIELHQQGVNVGGCALNVAIALHRLGIPSINALPLGNGTWASIVRQKLTEYGIHSVLETAKGDNGWCLALVEPDGERTFLSVSGVENQWDAALLNTLPQLANRWIYLSGYQLTSKSGDVLIAWLEQQSQPYQLLVDFGPRLADIGDAQFERVMACHPLITVNRQEAELLWHERFNQTKSFDAHLLMTCWQQRFDGAMVVRLDSEGAGFVNAETQGWMPALPTKVADTIGAGDSHAGGLLAGLASGWSLAESVALGNAVASYVVSQRGGDCAPDRATLTAYWQQRLTPQ